jgi:hypothetical protein
VSVTALDISLFLIFIYSWRKRIISDTLIDFLAQTLIHPAILLNMKSREIHIKHESKGKEVVKDDFLKQSSCKKENSTLPVVKNITRTQIMEEIAVVRDVWDSFDVLTLAVATNY